MGGVKRPRWPAWRSRVGLARVAIACLETVWAASCEIGEIWTSEAPGWPPPAPIVLSRPTGSERVVLAPIELTEEASGLHCQSVCVWTSRRKFSRFREIFNSVRCVTLTLSAWQYAFQG